MDPKKEQLMRDYLLRFVGVPYRWGGENPIIGYDCSGFVLEFLKAFGAWGSGDTNAQGIYNVFIQKKYPEVLKFGSICFYGKNSSAIVHCGISLGELFLIEAGGGNRDTISREDAANQNAFIRIRPINRRKDFLKAIYPWEET